MITVLYDEDCGFGRWSATSSARGTRESRLTFAAIQSPHGSELLRRHSGGGAARFDARRHHRTDRVWSGGQAVRVKLPELPGGSVPASIAAAFPAATDMDLSTGRPSSRTARSDARPTCVQRLPGHGRFPHSSTRIPPCLDRIRGAGIRETKKRDPWPGSLSSQILPPSSIARLRHSGSPGPCPDDRSCSGFSTWLNSWKIVS